MKIKEKIRNLIKEKQSNICVSLDLTNKNEIIKILNIIKSHVVMIKLHCDIIDDFDMDFIENINRICKENKILIFEDRKFADIGYIFKKQFQGGNHKISSWVNLITVHSLVGDGTIKEFGKIKKENQGILLIANMSNKNNNFDEKYKKSTIKLANKNKENVIGFICQNKVCDDTFLHFIPGVNINAKNDNSDQRYITPKIAINRGADIIIVGRGIISQKNVLESCILYKNICWDLYKNLLKK